MSESSKDRNYWIDEIAFLEARLNGSQEDIDKDDRAACEDALKAAKAILPPVVEPTPSWTRHLAS